ncbi:MAG: family 20 glycosylhydrolase [Caldilineaceae bacterium]
MTRKLSLLAPQPQELQVFEGVYYVADAGSVRILSHTSSQLFTAQWLKDALRSLDVDAQITASPGNELGDIVLVIDSALCPKPQSYRLTVDPSRVLITGADGAGLFYGVCTLCQLLDLYCGPDDDGAIPVLQIQDWPDFPYRGVMLDVSRDRVPTMETLYELVDMLAGLKVNQLQLYTEHTFAYAGHEIVWDGLSPITPQDVLELDAYCLERHMELVPNQNSFGHMHRWLKYDKYRSLAEVPDGILHPFTSKKEPYSLCPTDPRSIGLLAEMYAQLLPNFSSKQFNVGLDETYDLGMGRSKEICEDKGAGAVYIDFLKKIHELSMRHGRTMQFWSDIIVRDEPDLLVELPRDVLALEWGYEADYPFDQHTRLIAESGRSFYVCPGTSSWNTLAGRTDNAIGNLRNAAVNGFENGAIGFLNTDWGDNGHMQPPPVSYLGYLVGAAMSWNVDTAKTDQEPNWAAMLDQHVFRDRAGVMGQLAYDLGLAYAHAGAKIHNSSPLFWLLILPDALPAGRFADGTTEETLRSAEAYLDALAAKVVSSDMQRPDAELVESEYLWVIDMLKWAARLGIARLAVGVDKPVEAVDGGTRRILAAELETLIERFRTLWLQRSRPGGLDDSAGRLEKMLARLRGAGTVQ